MKSSGILLASILVVGAVLRLGLTLSIPPDSLLQIDGRDYYEISDNLAHGRGFSISHYRWFEPVPPDGPVDGSATGSDTHPDLYRPPLLPILGALLFSLPGDWLLWARILSVAIGCLLMLLVYLLGRLVVGKTVGLLAVSIFAFYPYALYYTSRWSTEDPYALCVAAAVLFTALGIQRRKPAFAFAAGLALGLATLARPAGLLMFGALTVFSLARGPGRARTRSTLFLVLGAALILTPWTVRNYSHTGRINPVTFFGDYNMWLGMNERMYEMYRAGQSEEFVTIMDRLYEVDLKQQVRRLEEEGTHDIGSISRHWREQTLQFVSENPRKALYILGHRFLHFWRPWPNKATVPSSLFWISTACLVPLFLLGVLGLFFSPKSRSPFLLIPPLATLAASLPFVFHLRFRYPTFEPYLILVAAVGIAELARRIKRSKEACP